MNRTSRTVRRPSIKRAEPQTSGPRAQPACDIGQLAFVGDDNALVMALQNGNRVAASALFDRYSRLVERTIARIVGADSELADLVHDAFVRALVTIEQLRDPRALPEWLTRLSVRVALDCLRKRRRKHWLRFCAPEEVPEQPVQGYDAETQEVLTAAYALLDRLPPEERAAFMLRTVGGLELKQVADACDCSLATVKRRISRAQTRFGTLAQAHPALQMWLEKSTRWGNP